MKQIAIPILLILPAPFWYAVSVKNPIATPATSEIYPNCPMITMRIAPTMTCRLFR